MEKRHIWQSYPPHVKSHVSLLLLASLVTLQVRLGALPRLPGPLCQPALSCLPPALLLHRWSCMATSLLSTCSGSARWWGRCWRRRFRPACRGCTPCWAPAASRCCALTKVSAPCVSCAARAGGVTRCSRWTCLRSQASPDASGTCRLLACVSVPMGADARVAKVSFRLPVCWPQVANMWSGRAPPWPPCTVVGPLSPLSSTEGPLT